MRVNYNKLDKAWFKKNQRLLLTLVNMPILGKIFRKTIRIKGSDKILILEPSAHHELVGYHDDGRQKMKSTHYTHWRYSKAIAKNYFLVFLFAHMLDEVLLDEYLPQYSFGHYDTLTVSSETGHGFSNDTCDGYMQNNPSGDKSWGITRGINFDGLYSTFWTTELQVYIKVGAINNQYNYMQRAAMSFDLTGIDSSSTCESGTKARIYVTSKFDNMTTTGLSATEWIPFDHPGDIDVFDYTDYVYGGDWNDYENAYNYGALSYSGISTSAWNEMSLNSVYIENSFGDILCTFWQIYEDWDDDEGGLDATQSNECYIKWSSADSSNEPEAVIYYTPSYKIVMMI